MLGTILASVIPVLYIILGANVSRYVAHTIDTCDSEDTIMAAVIVGVLWPLALPFYFALHGYADRRINR